MRSIKDLMEFHAKGNIPKAGIISINGDYFGKPGDAIYKIQELSYDEEKKQLTIKSRSEKFFLFHPKDIVIEKNRISIKAKEITRITPTVCCKFDNEPLFLFETW